MGTEDQALAVQSKKSRTNHHKGKHSRQKKNTRKSNKYLSKFISYTCDERGHLARDCPRNKYRSHKRKGNKKTHQAHAAEDEYDEPSKKRIKQESDDSSSDEEYDLISSLTRSITHGRNDWIIDNGGSKHMIGFIESFVKL